MLKSGKNVQTVDMTMANEQPISKKSNTSSNSSGCSGNSSSTALHEQLLLTYGEWDSLDINALPPNYPFSCFHKAKHQKSCSSGGNGHSHSHPNNNPTPAPPPTTTSTSTQVDNMLLQQNSNPLSTPMMQKSSNHSNKPDGSGGGGCTDGHPSVGLQEHLDEDEDEYEEEEEDELDEEDDEDEEEDDSLSDDDQSSTTSTSKSDQRAGDGGRVCDCCYCEVFGHGMPAVAPTSRNYTEMRERLRLRLSKRKAEKGCDSATAAMSGSAGGGSNSNKESNLHIGNVVKKKDILASAVPVGGPLPIGAVGGATGNSSVGPSGGAEDKRDLEELINFINGTDTSSDPKSGSSQPTQKEKKKKKEKPKKKKQPPSSQVVVEQQQKKSVPLAPPLTPTKECQQTKKSCDCHEQKATRQHQQNQQQKHNHQQKAHLYRHSSNPASKRETNHQQLPPTEAHSSQNGSHSPLNRKHGQQTAGVLSANANTKSQPQRQTIGLNNPDSPERCFGRSNSNNNYKARETKCKNKAKKKAHSTNTLSPDEVFLPKDVDIENGEMDEFEKELEAFKRFCYNSKPLPRKEKVNVNIKDIVIKKKSNISCTVEDDQRK